jgi:hypothetical protein
MSIRLFISFAAVAVLLAACSVQSPAPRFGAEHNAERVKRGLPVVLSQWENYNVGNNASEAAWRTTGYNFDSGRPEHFGKKVGYPSGALDWEEDYYYSGRKFDGSIIDSDSGTEWEKITVHYDYKASANPWQCFVISDRHGGMSGMKQITLGEAETIMSSWGLKRLNHSSEQDGAANESQPTRSDTNRTSSAAGSRR